MFTDVSVVFAAFIIIRVMITQAASATETSVNFHQSMQRSNPEDRFDRMQRYLTEIFGRGSNRSVCVHEEVV
jgi:hypothetical protein